MPRKFIVLNQNGDTVYLDVAAIAAVQEIPDPANPGTVKCVMIKYHPLTSSVTRIDSIAGEWDAVLHWDQATDFIKQFRLIGLI